MTARQPPCGNGITFPERKRSRTSSKSSPIGSRDRSETFLGSLFAGMVKFLRPTFSKAARIFELFSPTFHLLFESSCSLSESTPLATRIVTRSIVPVCWLNSKETDVPEQFTYKLYTISAEKIYMPTKSYFSNIFTSPLERIISKNSK